MYGIPEMLGMVVAGPVLLCATLAATSIWLRLCRGRPSHLRPRKGSTMAKAVLGCVILTPLVGTVAGEILFLDGEEGACGIRAGSHASAICNAMDGGWKPPPGRLALPLTRGGKALPIAVNVEDIVCPQRVRWEAPDWVDWQDRKIYGKPVYPDVAPDAYDFYAVFEGGRLEGVYCRDHGDSDGRIPGGGAASLSDFLRLLTGGKRSTGGLLVPATPPPLYPSPDTERTEG